VVKTAPALPDKALVLEDQLIASFFTGPKNKYERTFSGKLNAMDSIPTKHRFIGNGSEIWSAAGGSSSMVKH